MVETFFFFFLKPMNYLKKKKKGTSHGLEGEVPALGSQWLLALSGGVRWVFVGYKIIKCFFFFLSVPAGCHVILT